MICELKIINLGELNYNDCDVTLPMYLRLYTQAIYTTHLILKSFYLIYNICLKFYNLRQYFCRQKPPLEAFSGVKAVLGREV
jgi:hypothetical protein